MEWILIGSGILFLAVGIIGSIVPIIPGPPLSFVSLLFLEGARGGEQFTITFLVVMAVISVLVALIDNVLPIVGAKIYGAGKAGIWGAVLGLIAGIWFFPPLGIIFGVLVGAIAGEVMAGKSFRRAWRAGLATFVGNLAAVILKLVFCFVIVYYFVAAL
jgi:hypothetical protein